MAQVEIFTKEQIERVIVTCIFRGDSSAPAVSKLTGYSEFQMNSACKRIYGYQVRTLINEVKFYVFASSVKYANINLDVVSKFLGCSIQNLQKKYNKRIGPVSQGDESRSRYGNKYVKQSMKVHSLTRADMESAMFEMLLSERCDHQRMCEFADCSRSTLDRVMKERFGVSFIKAREIVKAKIAFMFYQFSNISVYRICQFIRITSIGDAELRKFIDGKLGRTYGKLAFNIDGWNRKKLALKAKQRSADQGMI